MARLAIVKAKKFVGAKSGNGVVHKIINLIPGGRRVLIEAFAGTAAPARALRPCDETILVDKVLYPQLRDTLRLVPRSRFHLGDGIGFLKRYRFTGAEIVYIDAPYMLGVLKQASRHYYVHELADADHGELLEVARGIAAPVIVSHYHAPLYDRELSDWNTREFSVMTRGGTKATEVLWWNFPTPTTLHDYRYVGDDWHARTRLKKKIGRAVADLVRMPPLERGAMFEAMAAAMRGPSSPKPERQALRGRALHFRRGVPATLAESGEPAGTALTWEPGHRESVAASP